MEFLKKVKEVDYPADYLLTRLRIRRASLAKVVATRPHPGGLAEESNRDVIGQGIDSIALRSEGDIWESVLREYQWVYDRMNKRLHEIFWPFFLYAELRTIIICLRYKKADEKNKIKNVLLLSLLSEEIKNTIEDSEDISALLERLEGLFAGFSHRFKGLKELYNGKGLRDVENSLINSYVGHMMSINIHPILKIFFSYLIDMRNIITLYKYLRWDIARYPAFLHSGTIREKRLSRIFEKHQLSEIGNMLSMLTRIKTVELTGRNIEDMLMKGLASILKNMGKDPLCLGVILEYLWLKYVTARNLNTILYGRGLHKDLISGEII
ncbi:MAG: V-type ATPase subunit [Thermodesulfovibrionales bacterium]|nr:V-type ATPase subunit [Thermodesulfovibrionales bacterium]